MYIADNSIDNLLEHLREKNVFLKLNEQNNLDIEAPREALQKDVIDSIRTNKQAIIDYLRNMTAKVIVGREIPVAPQDASYPLSSAQAGLWLASQVHEGSDAYNIKARLELEGNYDPVLFERAVLAVIDRHQSLRTVFREDATGTVRQWVLDPADTGFVLSYFDWMGDAEGVRKADRYIDGDTTRPFDLKRGPLFRMALFRLAENRYLLYYNLHHVICDAWSLNVLAEDVLAFYGSFRAAGSPPEPLRIQYKDYAVWQQSQLEGGVFDRHRTYWLSQFGGELPVLNLFGRTARPALQTTNGHVIGAFIKAEDAAPFRKLCLENGASLFMGIVASLNALFYKYSGEKDIIVGTPATGRDHPDLHGQIGYYINTLALRTAIAGADSFTTLLGKVRTGVMEAYDHQAYPFSQLVQDLQARRDASRSPLFDFFVNVQNTDNETIALRTGEKDPLLDADRAAFIDLGPANSKFDMIFNFHEVKNDLYVAVEFNSDIFKKEQVEQLIGHYRQLLRVVAGRPAEPLRELTLLSADEEQRLLFGFNDTETAYPSGTVMDLFDRQVKSAGEEPALSQGDRRISYAELDRRSNQVANHLRRQGIGSNSLVPVYMGRSMEFVIALIGILKTGAAYVPIDPGYPKERLSYVLDDIEATLLLADPMQEGSLADLDLQKLFLSDTHPLFGDEAATALPKGPSPEDLAYIIYTSGSTGTPKGVPISHGNLSNYMNWVLDAYIPEPESGTFGLYSAISFDLTVTSLFGSLLKGKCLHIFPQEMDIREALTIYLSPRSGMDIIKLTPSHVQLIESLELAGSAVKKVIVGGEPLQARHLHILRRLNPDVIVYNEYGPTEATVGCSVLEIDKDMEQTHIGRPIANNFIYVLDEGLKPVPPGALGELCISGAQVARGYWQRDGLTRERFIDDPFRSGQRMYRTGDTGYRLDDGSLEYTGRTDEQVKIRGFRVELGEIERLLHRNGTISEAAVAAKNINGDNQLIAYIVTGQLLDADALRDYLKEKLPDYMIPQRFIQVQELPLTVNGKVDKKRLPDPTETLYGGLPSRFVAPANAVEKRLAGIWKETLGLSNEISTVDNFFELGGHSIKALKMLSQVSKEFGIVIGVQKLFEEPTIQHLAEKIFNSGWVPADTAQRQDLEYERIKV